METFDVRHILGTTESRRRSEPVRSRGLTIPIQLAPTRDNMAAALPRRSGAVDSIHAHLMSRIRRDYRLANATSRMPYASHYRFPTISPT